MTRPSTSPGPLRYAVVTSWPVGYASRFVRLVAGRPQDRATLIAVVLCASDAVARGQVSQRFARMWRKTRRIGLLGALNGLRMRRWYGRDVNARVDAADIETECRQRGIPVLRIDGFTAGNARETLATLGLDLAVSMGNGYIPRSFFDIPKLGMINVHHELLPEYRGAQTAIWQIHNGSTKSGFSIHRLDDSIDTGPILLREEMPISFAGTLRDTIVETTARIQLRSVERLVELLDRFDEAVAAPIPNAGGRSYTTPSATAMLRVFRQWRRLRRLSGSHA